MRALLHRSIRNVMRRFYSRTEIGGVRVFAFEDASIGKVRDSLGLIATHDPLRLGRIRRDLEGVWVTFTPGALAKFAPADRFCELDPRFVTDASIDRIASTIIHEATHARLWRRKIGYDMEFRGRVEAVCLRQELLFAKKLGQPETLIDEIQNYLDAPADFWSDATNHRRELRDALEALRELNMPRWLIIFMLKRLRAKRKRQQRFALGSPQT